MAEKTRRSVMRPFIVFSIVLFLVLLISGGTAFIFAMQQIIRANKETKLSQLIEIKRMKLESSVENEIAIVMKMAGSPLIKEYFVTPDNYELKKIAQKEIVDYRHAFSGNLVFWIKDSDKQFYSDNKDTILTYTLNPEDPDNYWYNKTLYETERYNFNINYNPELKTTNLWINAPIFDDNRKPAGMIGTGINLSAFIDTTYKNYNEKVELYFFNSLGEITGARDIELVAVKKNINAEISKAKADIDSIAKTLAPDEIRLIRTPQGQLAIGTVKGLDWYAAAFSPFSVDDYNNAMTVLFFVVVAIVAFLLITFNIFIDRNLKALNKTMDELEAASKSKSEFLAAMSHEIRTPMNAIIGITQIQQRKADLPPEYADALGKIHRSGNNLLEIINNILDMSNIEFNELKLSPAEYDLPSLINDSATLNIARIDEKPVEFLLDLNESLPSKMLGDEMRLKQILNNLLSNAVKYTNTGFVKLSVDHSVNGNEITLRFCVSDSGKGIKDNDLLKMFSDQQRYDFKANRTNDGAGLGLNITQKLVSLMDGTIEAKSEYGKGSTFTVTVKQKITKCDAIGTELSQRLCNFNYADRKQSSRQNLTYEPMPYGRVLVVDDVEMNLFVAHGLLSPYQLQVDTAVSGFAALDKVLNGEVYDIIFMDHMMPEMDGIETAKKIRGFGYKGIITALTANALAGNDEMFRRNGFDDFLSKPVDIRFLDAMLHKYVRGKHPNDAQKAKTEAAKKTVSTVPARTAKKLVMTPRIIEVFCRDAGKTVIKIRETVKNSDIKLFTTTVHGMKSALAHIGESESSALAFELEKAGLAGDIEFINSNMELFIEKLEAVVLKLSPEKQNESGANDSAIQEETAYLKEQLQLIKSACENYDDTAAYASLDNLKNKTWKAQTKSALDEIYNMLFLHSNFDGAAAKASNMLDAAS
ncbi:MAG: ATP-binding protein [Chitinispirillia bacterium]|nr:ATP-binding protein [Chitinispirillia bacterium]